MSPKELTAFRIEPEVLSGLRRVKEQEFIPMSVQVDQALRAWLKAKGVTVGKPPKPRGRSRKR
jgi:hypothetical protein